MLSIFFNVVGVMSDLAKHEIDVENDWILIFWSPN